MNVSVIIPTLNEEKYIASCLTGLINQTIPPDEIIVIDGNSTDGTVDISMSYTNNVYITDTRGIGAARAIGVEKSSGDIILSTDADTTLDKHFIEYGIEDLDNAVAVTGRIKANDIKGKKWEFLTNLSTKGRGHNTMFRRTYCDVNSCYITMGKQEDWKLWDDLKRKGTVAYDPRLICYTRLPTNMQKKAVTGIGVASIPITCYSVYHVISRL